MSPLRQRHDDRENHRRGAHHSRANQHRFRRCLERIAGPVIGLEQVLRALKVNGKVEIFLDLGLNVRYRLDQRQFVNGLRIIRDWTVGVDRDCDRSHPKESERHQSEREHRWSQHARSNRQSHRAHVIGDRHQHHHRKSQVVAGEIARHES